MLLTICKTLIIIYCISCAYTLCMRLAKDRQEHRMMIAAKEMEFRYNAWKEFPEDVYCTTSITGEEMSDASESDNRDGSF